MDFSKYVELDTIVLENRRLVPIARISGYGLEESYLFLEYTVVAFIITEGDLTYYENIMLSQEDYELLKDDLLY
ncbi:MAG: hypothetical protein BZ137_03970 [Methanosphaera sp. rholeuAM130]|nr:MAG: hypothetical protein BZ137_03970 [Methanosphaera sp. rholeuAM130]